MFVFGVMPAKIKNYKRTIAICVSVLYILYKYMYICHSNFINDIFICVFMDILYSIFPSYTKGLVEAIFKPCSEFLWEKNPRPPGLLVYNAATGQEMRVWITVRRLIEDSQGLSKPGCCRFHPSFIGACPWCNVVGVRCANTTVYPSFLANAIARSEPPQDQPASGKLQSSTSTDF